MPTFLRQTVTLLILVLSALTSRAENHYSLEGRLRSRPQSMNLIGTAAHDGRLWGEKKPDNPLYGFYQLGARLGGSPTAAAFLQIAPIAPLVFGVERSMTQRFLNTAYFDCDEIECLGRIDRTDFTVKMAGAYQSWVLFASLLDRNVKTPDSNTAVALEHESLIVPSGTHRFFESAILLGYKLSQDHFAGILYNAGEIQKQSLRFQATYALYQFRWMDLSWTAGAGPYTSTHENLNGTSFVFSVGKDWGESLSLF